MKKEEFLAFAKRNEPLFQVLNAAHFSGQPYRAPKLRFTEDERSYYDPQEEMFSIGLGMIWMLFHPASKEDAFNAVKFICLHEWQHKLSTASAPFGRAITRGTREFVRYIAEEVEGKPVVFRNDRDVAHYVTVELPKKGFIVDISMLNNMSHYVANSIEDGRIERLCSGMYAGFEPLRRTYRGRQWEEAKVEGINYEALLPMEKLNIMMGQVLSLSTTQLFQKGFLRTYAGTPFIGEVTDLTQFIGRGVMSGKTRGMEVETVNVCRTISPVVWEAIKSVQSDLAAMKMMEDLMKAIIESIAENAGELNLSEHDEVSDDGGAETAFPISDIKIEVDAETFKKLKEKASKEGKEGGIMVTTKDPLDDEKSESGSCHGASSGSSSSPDGKSKEEASSSESSSEGRTEKGKKPKMSGGGKGSSEDGKPSSESGDGADAEPDSDDAPVSGNSSSSLRKMEPKSSLKGKAVTSGGSSMAGTEEDLARAEALVRSAIHTAEEVAREDAADTISMVNQADNTVSRSDSRGVIKDTEREVIPSAPNKVMGDDHYKFKEILREYEVDTDLPPALKAKGRALHKQYERYFRARRTLNVTHLEKGAIDQARLYALAMGDTDVFRRRGQDKLFDGCAYILLDNSGSMCAGLKFKEACTAAALIEESFKGMFPVKIASFSDDYRCVIHQRIKGWDESLQKNCVWSYYTHRRPNGGNADGCSIGVAVSELLKRPEKKKLLVVLSDGQPTEGSSNPVDLTRKQVAAARKKGIRVAGIYFENGRIGGDADIFRSIYGKGKDGICTTTDKIYTCLEKVVQEFTRV